MSTDQQRFLERGVGTPLDRLRFVSPPISKRPASDSAPLTFAQEQVWEHVKVTNHRPALYNESITIHRHGGFDRLTLQRCCDEIIRRHEAWRTTFAAINNHPVQIIHAVGQPLEIAHLDLRTITESFREREALEIASQHSAQTFDLEEGPLVRALLITLNDYDHRLFLTMHQIIVDGVSVYQVLPFELSQLYDGSAIGAQSPLPELTLRYGDYAYWERHCLSESILENSLAYWRRQLQAAPSRLKWSVDTARPPVQSFRGAIFPFALPESLTQAIRELSRRESVTLFMILLSAFNALLYGYTHQDDIVVGTLAPGGRKRKEVKGLLGYFLNPVAIRTAMTESCPFRELLRTTKYTLFEALSHDDVPFSRVAKDLALPTDQSRHPLFQVMISLAPPLSTLPEGWNQTPMDVESGNCRWDLYLEFSERPNHIIGRAQYNPDMFSRSDIQHLTLDYERLLEAATVNPIACLGDLEQAAFSDNSRVFGESRRS